MKMLQLPIYLDNHATTRVDPRVVEAMLPYFTEIYGNPGSTTHGFGAAAKDAVDEARTKVAAAIGAKAKEIVWTSGATESNNLAIRGVAEKHGRSRAARHQRHDGTSGGARSAGEAGPAGIRNHAPAGHGRAESAGRADSTSINWPRPSATTRSWSRSCSPTTRSGPFSPWPRSAGCANSGACCCTPMPRRPWARSRSTWKPWASIS